MKAAVVERYGPPEVVKIKEVPNPVPKDNEVLVKVHATTVNSGDARVRALRVPRGLAIPVRLSMGLFGPRRPILGLEAAGEVEAVGKDVTRYKPGDKVVASRGFDFKCHAEYVCVPEDGAITVMPASLTYAEAVALLFGGTTAVIFFRNGDLKPGESILINGASGAVGTVAVQLAKHIGAEVTAVCSAANVDLVRSLGADRVIDYTKEDFTGSGIKYDVIMDNAGNAPYSRIRDSLKDGGRFLMVIGDLPQMIHAAFVKRIINETAEANGEVFREIAELTEKGALKPVIDRTWSLEEIAEAHRYVDTERKKGSVVITVNAG